MLKTKLTCTYLHRAFIQRYNCADFLHLAASNYFTQLQLSMIGGYLRIKLRVRWPVSLLHGSGGFKMYERFLYQWNPLQAWKMYIAFLLGFLIQIWCMSQSRPQLKDSKSWNLLLSIVCMTFSLTASQLSVIIQGCTFNDRRRDFAYRVSRSPWNCSEIIVIYSYCQGKVYYESPFVFTWRWVKKLQFCFESSTNYCSFSNKSTCWLLGL